jgi:hypothetical protein
VGIACKSDYRNGAANSGAGLCADRTAFGAAAPRDAAQPAV